MPCFACSITLLELFVRRATGLDVKLAARSTRISRAIAPQRRAYSSRSPSIFRYSVAPRGSDLLQLHQSEPVLNHDELQTSRGARSITSSEIASLENNFHHPRVSSSEQQTGALKGSSNDVSSKSEHVDVRQGSVLELNDENLQALLEAAATNETKEPAFNRHRRNDWKSGDARAQRSRPRRGSPAESLSTQDKRWGRSERQAVEDGRGHLDTAKPISKDGIATKTPFGEDRQPWQIQKDVLSKKFGEAGWNPRKRLSPDALEGIRALHAQDPNRFTTPFLADQFQVSAEAIRRILKSKWRPTEDEQEERKTRWDKRGEKIWTKMVELGAKPPKKWREMGVGMPQWKLDKDAKRRDARRNKERTIPYTEDREPESERDVAVSRRIL